LELVASGLDGPRISLVLPSDDQGLREDGIPSWSMTQPKSMHNGTDKFRHPTSIKQGRHLSKLVNFVFQKSI